LNISALAAAVCPPLDRMLADQLLSEYVSLENRYALGDWEPATLDAGQLAEAASRIVYHQDSGKLDRRRGVNECLNYVEDLDRKGNRLSVPNTHMFPDSKAAMELAKVIRHVYRFRSRRGAVHITPDYTANQLDSQFVLASSRWIVCEILRIFLVNDPASVASATRSIVRIEVPAIGQYSDRRLVQRTGLTSQEEVLLLLYHVGSEGLKLSELVRDAAVSRPSVSKALSKLESARVRQAVKVGDKHLITDLGIKRVIEEILPKISRP